MQICLNFELRFTAAVCSIGSLCLTRQIAGLELPLRDLEERYCDRVGIKVE
jgi:hypothetical protein